MTWKHIAAITVGAAVGVVGVVATGGAALLPLATLIVGGALGHAQGQDSKSAPVKNKWDGVERRQRRPTIPPEVK